MFIGEPNEAPGLDKVGEPSFKSAEETKRVTHADRVEQANADFHKLANAAEVQALEDAVAGKPVGDLEAEAFKTLEGSRDNEV
ncbi:hypothetical protein EPO04_02605 [Patescibacteria group bacterium]|nr:MAG: hypothetical protein EPO04_02605 [Patescibacteria group bacterium]